MPPSLKSSPADPDRDEDEGDDADAGERQPLAVGINGDPIVVPEEAEGWRVSWRKVGERGGSPTLLYAKGRPLILPLDATADDLAEEVGGRPGRYRLDPVDENGNVITGSTPAYSVFDKPPPAAAAPVAATSVGELGVALANIDRMAKTMMDALVAHTNAMATVVTAMSSAVMPAARRQVVEYVDGGPAVAPPAPEQQGFDWQAALAAFLPMAQQAFQVWIKSKESPLTVIGATPEGEPIVGR